MSERALPPDHNRPNRLINDQPSYDEAQSDEELVANSSCDTEYRVGPGHPPREYQFRKGQSGNILGAKVRKRSPAPDLKALLESALNQKLAKRQGEKLVTKAAAGMQQLVDQFAQGDPRARRDLISHLRKARH